MPEENILAPTPFNPLDKRHLGESVASAMLQSQIHKKKKKKFKGAGIYAIYYDAYRNLAQANRDNQFSRPIYVGKAVPPGARKGGFGLGGDPGTALYKRLTEHFESVKAAENLNESDFFCRYLVVDDIWIPLAESLLIEKFQPVWNRVLDGFGNHDPGSGRYAQQKSPWDELHPGREWANRLRPCANTQDILMERVVNFLQAGV